MSIRICSQHSRPRKDAEGGNERYQAASRHACGRRHHVLFRDAELEIAFGIGVGKLVKAVGELEIRRSGNDGMALLYQFNEAVREVAEAGIACIKGCGIARSPDAEWLTCQISRASISATAFFASSGIR